MTTDIFCDEDCSELAKLTSCPACQLPFDLYTHSFTVCMCVGGEDIGGDMDVTKIDLHPSEQYKSVSLFLSPSLSFSPPLSLSPSLYVHLLLQMVLAGHKPETIMEICSRALTFWTYQVHHSQIVCVHVHVCVCVSPTRRECISMCVCVCVCVSVLPGESVSGVLCPQGNGEGKRTGGFIPTENGSLYH